MDQIVTVYSPRQSAFQTNAKVRKNLSPEQRELVELIFTATLLENKWKEQMLRELLEYDPEKCARLIQAIKIFLKRQDESFQEITEKNPQLARELVQEKKKLEKNFLKEQEKNEAGEETNLLERLVTKLENL